MNYDRQEETLLKLRRPARTSPAVYMDREVLPDVVLISNEQTKHKAHLVALASRVEYIHRRMMKRREEQKKEEEFATMQGYETAAGSSTRGGVTFGSPSSAMLRFKTQSSAKAIELLLSWVYRGQLTGINPEIALVSLRFAMRIDALEFSYDIHEWIQEHLAEFDDDQLFRLLALSFHFVQYDLGVMYTGLLLRRGANLADGVAAVDGKGVDDEGLWAMRLLAAAVVPERQPGGKRLLQNAALKEFDMRAFSDLKLKSCEGSIHPTTRAFWAQCSEIRDALRDPNVTTLKVDGDKVTCGFLVKLINGETIKHFTAEEFQKVYTMAHQYELQQVMDTLDYLSRDIFSFEQQLLLLGWSSAVPRGMLGPRLASWLWHCLTFDSLRDAPPKPITTTGAMAVKFGLTLRSLPEGDWQDFTDRAHRGLTFVHTVDHRLIWFV